MRSLWGGCRASGPRMGAARAARVGTQSGCLRLWGVCVCWGGVSGACVLEGGIATLRLPALRVPRRDKVRP